jgi:hypothetical protein
MADRNMLSVRRVFETYVVSTLIAPPPPLRLPAGARVEAVRVGTGGETAALGGDASAATAPVAAAPVWLIALGDGTFVATTTVTLSPAAAPLGDAG